MKQTMTLHKTDIIEAALMMGVAAIYIAVFFLAIQIGNTL